jgi:hypothetical protein
MPCHLLNPTNNNPSQNGQIDKKLTGPTKQSILPREESWIASRSLSSGAHSRDPLARNDV